MVDQRPICSDSRGDRGNRMALESPLRLHGRASYHRKMNRKMREQQAGEKRKIALEMIALSQKLADPNYTARAAGFWLRRQAPPSQRVYGM